MNDRLVKADCSAQLSLKAGVVINFVVPKGLLYHQQIELVELTQMLDLIERVSRVRIAAQYNI